ncbi:hypothetical protein BGW41_005829 [Actinomortierella wolfii]|nr:hypothetical protein BGW41_005829 [Actinomortierella wolfii]
MWPMDSLPEANVHSYIGVLVAVAGNILISVALNVQKYAHNELSAATPSLDARASFANHTQDEPGVRRAEYTMLQGDMMMMESDDNSDHEADGATTTVQDTRHTHRHSLSNTNSNTHSRLSSDEGRHVSDTSSSQSDISDTISQARPSICCNDDDEDDIDHHTDHQARRPLLQPGTRHDKESSSSSSSSTPSNFDYLHSKAWWLGMVLMILGECGNFLAYGFAPASVVAPLGTVALISNVILAPLMLRERFRRRDLIGIVIAIIGAVVVVVNSKSDEVKLTPEAMLAAICQVQFVIYFFCSCIAVAVLASLSDTIGPRYILVDLSIVAIFGGYTVLATKGVSSLLSLSFYKMFTYPISYLLVFVLISTAVFQIKYLNKSLQRFDSTQVIPTQFVLFTISAIIGSAILYNDFDEMDFVKGLHFLTGCCMTFLGVYFITSQRDDLVQDTPSVNIQHHPEWILTPQDAFLNGPAASATVVPTGTSSSSATGGRYLYQEPERSDTLMEQGFGSGSSYGPMPQLYRQTSTYGRSTRPDSIRQSVHGSSTPFGSMANQNASTPLLSHSTTKGDRTSTSLTEAGNLLLPRDNDVHYGTIRSSSSNNRPFASASTTALPLAMAGATPMIYSHSGQPYDQAAKRRSTDLSQELSRRGSLGYHRGGSNSSHHGGSRPPLKIQTSTLDPIAVPTNDGNKAGSIQNTLVESPRSVASSPIPRTGANAHPDRRGSKSSLRGEGNQPGRGAGVAGYHGHGVQTPSEHDFVQSVAHRSSVGSPWFPLVPPSGTGTGTGTGVGAMPPPKSSDATTTSGPIAAFANRLMPTQVLSSSPLAHSMFGGGPSTVSSSYPTSSTLGHQHVHTGSEYAIDTLPKKRVSPLESPSSESPPISPLTTMFKGRHQQHETGSSSNATIPLTTAITPSAAVAAAVSSRPSSPFPKQDKSPLSSQGHSSNLTAAGPLEESWRPSAGSGKQPQQPPTTTSTDTRHPL